MRQEHNTYIYNITHIYIYIPLRDVASKWAFLVVICLSHGVARSCRKLLQLKQHVTTIYLQ